MTSRQDLDARVSGALVRMMRRAEEAQERAARNQGIHPTDFRCIGYLAAMGSPVSPRDIATYLGLTSGACTALLDRMERAGYIRRDRHPDDRRSVLIVLDAEAAAKPLAVHERIRKKYEAATRHYTDAELEAIARYLEQLQLLSRDMGLELYPQTEAEIPDL